MGSQGLTLRIAVMVDGAFFLKRHSRTYGAKKTAFEITEDLYDMVRKHTKGNYLYRVLFYDCAPLDQSVRNPVSGQQVNFGTTETAKFRLALFEELKKRRKLALRLGTIHRTGNWLIRPATTRALLEGKTEISALSHTDVYYEMTQKGVDMRIGLDIASLAYKRAVEQIVLISGDSDFVPAIKLARREGIDVVLDPMWNHINPELHEHIDGLRSYCPKPKPIQPT